MRILSLQLTVYCFLVIIFYSCSSCNNEESEQDNEPFELLIAKEDARTELLWKRIDNVTSEYMLITNAFKDSVLYFQDVKNNFQNLLLHVRNYSESLNSDMLVTIENEYNRLADFLSLFKAELIIADEAYHETVIILNQTSNRQLMRFVAKQFYNELLTQRLNIMNYKYDSTLFECHDSLTKYNMNPYSNTFITTERSTKH